MKKLAAWVLAAAFASFAPSAFAQPGPPPDPWIVNGATISYGGAVIVGAPTGGGQGNGSINAQSIYVNGVAVSAGGGSVSTVSCASANGFACTVANPTTTPVLTLQTTVTGIMKGNGTSASAAIAGTDYVTPTGSGAGLTGITWSQIGSTPTTVAGYGITNALLTTNNLSDLASASSARSNLGLGTFATQNFATPPAIGAGTPAAGSFTVLTVTGSFTATGLVTNADLANASTTVNGQTCTLGSSCTITASAGTISVGVTTVASGTNGYLLTDNAGTLGNVSLASLLTSPPPIGGSAPAAGAFTTLSASSTVSGTGFSTYLASPPAIGGAAPAAGAFTNLSASGTVSGAGFSTYLASPPAIGTSAPAAGAFTTLAASSTVSGAGFTALFASPPAIGGTAPAAGSFTTLVANGAFTAESTNAIPSNGASGEGIFFFNTIASFGIYGGAGTPTVNAPTGSFYLDHTAGIPYYNTSSGSSGTTWTQVGTGSGSGCTVAGGSQYQILVNNGSSGCSSSLNASVNGGALALGSSGTPGSITLGNSASGTLQLVAVTGALGTAVAQFPANNGVVAETNLIQTWTAGQLFANGDLQLLGSSTGITSLFSDNGGASNFTIHVPAVNGTIAEINLAQTWSAAQTFTNADLKLAGSSSGAGTLEAPAAASTYVWTLPAATDQLIGRATTDTLTNKTLSSSTDVLGGVTLTLGSDATGDIYYRNSGGVLTRLGIGTSTQVLTVAAGLPSWAAASGGTGCTTGGIASDLLTADGSGGCTTVTASTLTNGALTLGSSGTPGSVTIGDATSGTAKIQATGALGTTIVNIPAINTTDTLVTLAATQTLTGKSIAASEVNSGTLAAAQMLPLTTNYVYQGNGSNQPAAVALSAALDAAIGSTQGDILYRGAGAWTVLAPGTSGNFLQTQGAAANPVWAAAGGTATGTTIYTTSTALASGDNGKTVLMNCSSSCTASMPSVSACFNAGIVAVNAAAASSGPVSISGASSRVGSTVQLSTRYAGATIFNCIANSTDYSTWVVAGDIVP